MEKYFVWYDGYLKVLVYEHKYLDSEHAPDETAGYYDCVKITDPERKKLPY